MDIIMKLVTNESLVKCLINSEGNCLDTPIPDNFDLSSLVYDFIYPFKFVPTPDTTAKSFITMQFNYKPNGITFKNGSIFFYIICHNSLIKTDYGSLRYDMILDYIDQSFNSEQDLELKDSFISSRDLGIGKLPFYETYEFVVNENYSGVCIAYKTNEFACV